MVEIWVAVGAVFLLFALLNAKRSRSDGVHLAKIHPYRTMMGHIMPSRNGSVVYYDSYIDAEPLLSYLEVAQQRFPCNMTHAVVAAASFGLIDNPKMNRFISGRRFYQRKGEWVTFSAKRKRLNREAKLTALKYAVDREQTFEQLCRWIDGQLQEVRSEKVTHEDKELGFFASWPRPLLRFGINVVRAMDYYNILFPGFIRGDGFYTSIFVANLGSIGMAPGYHHLYEWGNCPLFMMVGKVEPRPVVEGDAIVIKKQLHIRWSYDERIDDGLTARYGMASVQHALENPLTYFGCLKDDGSDALPFGCLPNTERDSAPTQRRAEAA